MAKNQKIAHIVELLNHATSHIVSAKVLLAELLEGNTSLADAPQKIATLKPMELVSTKTGGRIVEGAFDGQNMIGTDQKSYPVPANYASKSKLVAGDTLKLTIMEDGAFVYKQIGPVARKRCLGVLTYENGQYAVKTEVKIYKVLLASVTFFKAEVGQNVTIVVPEEIETSWAAIENVVVDNEVEQAVAQGKKMSPTIDETIAFDIEKL